jgi:hypothetical protein
MKGHPFQVHNMPAVYVLETQMPQQMIDDVNDYMDEYRQDKNKKSLAKTLVGQIDKGEQLLLDHDDKRMVEYNSFICNLGAEYINYFGRAGNTVKNDKRVEIVQLILFTTKADIQTAV